MCVAAAESTLSLLYPTCHSFLLRNALILPLPAHGLPFFSFLMLRDLGGPLPRGWNLMFLAARRVGRVPWGEVSVVGAGCHWAQWHEKTHVLFALPLCSDRS